MARRPKRYTLSRAAAADLESIYTYGLTQWGAQQAERYQDNLFAALQAIATGSRRGRPLLDSYLKVSVGSHLVVFREDEGVIYVTRILHQRMDIARHLEP